MFTPTLNDVFRDFFQNANIVKLVRVKISKNEGCIERHGSHRHTHKYGYFKPNPNIGDTD